MENYKKTLSRINFFEGILEQLNVDSETTNSVKERQSVESEIIKVKAQIAELNMIIDAKLHVRITDHCRCFEPCEFDIPIKKGCVNYMVGGNGSGKTTILQKIRSEKDSLYDLNKRNRDGMTSHNVDIVKCEPIEINGVDDFSHVFALDAIEDDPLNLINAATAYGLVAGGGFAVQHRSKGEKTKIMLSQLITNIQNTLNFTVDNYRNGKEIEGCTPLILIDEIDEGMDFKSMLTYDRILTSMCNIFNATVICVTHNPLVCFGSKQHDKCNVFDMRSFSEMTISDYIFNETGMRLSMTTPPSVDKQGI